MNQATALLIGKGLSALISLTTTYIGAKQASDMLDRIRQKMVDENRAPTEDEIAAQFQGLEDRSDKIQNS
jgi:hypothetical protein